ncbi:MAG: DUF3883 domain-containing protein, partial [Candidatus Delongbacteria bacterium]|nr:DUF3883 domain-containing protein [Candidatus Delongbacteria bacterium]
IPVGSRFFLIRLGSADKGIIGSGVTTSETYYDTSWEQSKARSRSKALYVGLRFDFLSKVPLIKLQELQVHPLSSFYWSIRASGIYMPSEIALSLENIWLRKTKIQSNSTHKNSQCWLIKTTEGGPGYRDHWADFMSEKVVAVGWTAIKYDPSQFEHLEQYQKQIKAKYKWDTSYASSTIFKFSHQWQENDIAIICTGYAPNQTKDVYINGIARIGKYFYDKKSKWWRFKRQAVITPIDRYVPVKIFQKFLIKSSRQTIHGPFSQHKFQAFVNEIGFRLPVSDSRLPENTKHDLDSSQSTQRGGGFGSAKENKKVEEAAMRFVTRWYRKKGWSVSDVSAQCRGYDLHCVKGTTILHVEVKGSKGRDHQFIITPNEKQRWEVDPLFVLSLVTNIENTPTINQFKGASAMKSFCFNALSYMAVSIGS